MSHRELPKIENITDASEYAKEIVKCAKSCSYFTEQFMGLEVFDYNKAFLDCFDRFIVFRSGRQCLEENEYVYCDNSIKKSNELKNGDKIFGGIVDDYKKFEDDLLEIRFWNGIKIKVNGEHPFYTNRGWVNAEDLTTKDRVMFIDSNMKSSESIGKNKARLFGYLYSDGYYAEKQSVKFVNNNQGFHSEVREIVSKEFDINSRMTENNTRQLLVGKHGSTTNSVIDYIKKYNLMDNSLSIIMNLPDDELKEFINGYFNGDGYLYVGDKKERKQKKIELGFSIGISEKRAYEIQYILWRLGIDSIVKKEWMKKSTRPFYRVLISRQESLLKILKWIDRQKYPDKFENADKNITKCNFKRYGNFIEYNDGYKMVKIRKITHVGKGNVVGFSVTPNEEIYSYCGMRTHNCGKSRNAALKAIHFGYFAPLFAGNLDEGVANVVIASLSKDQAFLIFNKISNYIHKSPSLNKNILRETRTEMTIEWYDGKGKTNFIVRPIGDTGDSLRGFTSHMAVLDEAAYIPQTVYDAFLPSTVTTKPHILLTSTPRGKAGKFFEACMKSHIIYEKGKPRQLHDDKEKYPWTQFHVTTFDNPLAANDPSILKLIGGTTKAAERQELYGEFLDSGNSLVPYNLLQEAQKPIQRPKSGFDYYDLGVDTSGKGSDETVLITIGVRDEMVYPVDIYTELTTEQPALARKIRELHRIYGYRRIYIDETGMGDTLMDLCREEDLPVYGINFKSDKTEIYVNLERLFEERLINFSLLDDYSREKLAEQISYMYWEYGKYKDQPPKVRTEHSDDFSDACALAVVGQQKVDFFQEIPMDMWFM